MDHKLLAQSGEGLGTIGGSGLGPFGNLNFSGQAGGVTALSKLTGLISAVVGFMTILAGIWFLFQLLTSGYEWISSGGDSKKLQSAKDRMSHAFFGLLIIIASWALLSLTGQFLGYDILLSNPGTIIQQFQIR